MKPLTRLKNIYFFILLLLLSNSKILAQNINYNIKGTIDNPGNKKIAFLCIYDYPEANETRLIERPIINGSFNFSDSISIGKSLYRIVGIALEEDLLVNRDEKLREMKNDLTSKNLKIICIDSLVEIKVFDAQNIKSAVVGGSKLNSIYNQLDKVLKSNDYQVFFESYPESPICLSLLSSLIKLHEQLPLSKDDLLGFYNHLSPDLKESSRGKELFDKIKLL